jgi:SAM-dependent methyltransferase
MQVFSSENGFVEENGLGYDAESLLRQNARYEKYMAPFVEQFQGKRVLDLGAADGRWSFASLVSGAASVVAIEYRKENIALAKHLLKPDMAKLVTFNQGDMFDVMPKLRSKKEKFDIILCLGMVQHVADHNRLMRLMTAFQPELIIVDGRFVDSDDRLSILKADPVKGPNCAAPSFAGQTVVPVNIISRAGFVFLARCHGYKARMLPWKKTDLENPAIMGNYFRANEQGIKTLSMALTPAEPEAAAATEARALAPAD